MQEFWEFAIARYARPGVAPCCLALQDELGANVMLLLYCCWRAADGEVLDGTALRQAMARVEPIDHHLVRPLRAARRAIRRAADALESPALAAASRRLKQAELAAEHAQAALLMGSAAPLPLPAGSASARARAAASLRACLEASGAAAARASAAGGRLAALVFDA